MTRELPPLSVVIATYERGPILIETIGLVLDLEPRPAEVLVVDQTPRHDPRVERKLGDLERGGSIRWLRQSPPSIPGAMNRGLREAGSEVVLFLDDDLLPWPDLIREHLRLHGADGPDLVAGRVIQPWDESEDWPSAEPVPARDFMGGNFSVGRSRALALGGFDENFLRVAYRFEADFAGRLLDDGGRILFNPAAVVRHLKAESGGTREYGVHYRTIRPDHAVGEYYYLLRGRGVERRLSRLFLRPFRAIATRFHLRHPWWIPMTLLSESCGLAWAAFLALKGPRYISRPATPSPS